MNKHFEKLVQCDHRLFHLSRVPEIIMDFPYFDARQSIFEDPSERKGYPYGNLNLGIGPSIASPVGAQSSSEHMYLSHEAPSPSSGTVITAPSSCFHTSLFGVFFPFHFLLN